MEELRYNGRVAIVTGAGGNPGLGRAHAMLLASRGAKVVVNDIGSSARIRGANTNANAETVAREIRDAGGEAVADTHSVVGEDSAKAVVQTATEAFGRIDILVNNAGVAAIADIDEVSVADIELTIGTSVFGTIYMTRAVWPHMVAQKYGRIINTSSGVGYAGLARGSIYAAAKAGVFGFTRSIAMDGDRHGIRCNAVAPAAWTGMWSAAWGSDHATVKSLRDNDRMKAEYVSPAVALLAHEQCPVNGECISSQAGRSQLVVVSHTTGIEEQEPTPESALHNWSRIADTTDALPLTVEAMIRHGGMGSETVVYEA